MTCYGKAADLSLRNEDMPTAVELFKKVFQNICFILNIIAFISLFLIFFAFCFFSLSSSFFLSSPIYVQVAITYLDIPDVDRAANSLITAAKAMNNEESKELFKEACDLIWNGEDNLDDIKVGACAHEVFENYFEYLIKIGDFEEARKMLPSFVAILRHNDMGHTLCKAHLCSAILDMQNGDFVRAQVLKIDRYFVWFSFFPF